MSDKPLISVLIPAYNHEIYVQETIQSIIEQTYEQIELIVLDDGSTDNTLEKIRDMQSICEKRFRRVSLITQENQGLSPTLVKLYSLAQGQYVFAIASDDLVKPHGIEILYEAMKNDEYVLAVGDNEIIDAHSQPIAWDDERNSVPWGNGYNTFWSFLSAKRPQLKDLANFGSYGTLLKDNYMLNGQLINKDAYQKTGGYCPQAPLEDWYMSLQLSKVGRFKFIDQVLFSYRWHGKNSILQGKKMLEYARLTMQYEGQLIEQSSDSELKQIFHKQSNELEWKQVYNPDPITIKHFIEFKNIFALYKRKDMYRKRIIVELFGKKIISFTYGKV